MNGNICEIWRNIILKLALKHAIKIEIIIIKVKMYKQHTKSHVKASRYYVCMCKVHATLAPNIYIQIEL